MNRRIVALALGLSTISLSHAALADEPPTKKAAATENGPRDEKEGRPQKDDDDRPLPWSAGAQIGAGSDNLGLGIGARLGYTLPMRLYVGGAFTYYATTASYGNGSVYVLLPGGEVGYDAKLGPVVLRPYGGVGMAVARASVRIGGVDATASDSRAAVWAGAQLTYDVTRNFYVGGDLRLLAVVNGNGSAVAGFGSLGARF